MLKKINDYVLNRIRNVNKIWLYVIPFFVLSIPVLIMILSNKIPQVSGYYLLHYVLTYDHGFVGRGLMGEILSWIFDTLTIKIINNINMLFMEILVIISSLCIGKSLSKTRNNPESFFVVFYLLLFLCLGEFTSGTFYTDVKMDKLLWAIAFLCVYISDSKYSFIFIPLLSVVCVLINPVFCFSGFVIVAIALFDKFQRSSYSKKSGLALILTCISIVSITVFAALYQPHLGFNNANEFIDFYFGRTDIEITDDLRQLFANEWLFEYFDNSASSILNDTFGTYFVSWGNGIRTLASSLFLFLPFLGCITVFWGKAFKLEKDKFRRFIYLICCLSFSVIIPPIILSWEAAKYYGYYILTNFCLIIYFLNRNDLTVRYVINNFKEKFKNKPIAWVAVFNYFLIVLMVK